MSLIRKQPVSPVVSKVLKFMSRRIPRWVMKVAARKAVKAIKKHRDANPRRN